MFDMQKSERSAPRPVKNKRLTARRKFVYDVMQTTTPSCPLMRTDLFDFDLPEDRIALQPATPRDAARLLVVRPGTPSPRATPTSPRAPTARGEGRGEGPRQSPTLDCAAAPHPSPLPASGERGLLLDDRHIGDLPDLLRPGDALVLNDTRVIRAALQGERIRGPNRAVVSVNLHKRLDEHR